jgi:DNA-binding NtrC family response regulator
MFKNNQFKSILLIDDDEDDCLFFNQAISHLSSDISLICSKCADNLLEIIEVNKPFLIFIDMHMPKKNGIDCLNQIKSHSKYKNLPVVIWSTSNFTSNIVAAYEAGAQLYYQKPCSFLELVAALKEILQHNKLKLDSMQATDHLSPFSIND